MLYTKMYKNNTKNKDTRCESYSYSVSIFFNKVFYRLVSLLKVMYSYRGENITLGRPARRWS